MYIKLCMYAYMCIYVPMQTYTHTIVTLKITPVKFTKYLLSYHFYPPKNCLFSSSK